MISFVSFIDELIICISRGADYIIKNNKIIELFFAVKEVKSF